MHVFETLPWWGYAWLAVVMVASGFFHGLIGFGFPIIATPLLTLMFDFKTALLLSVLPGFITTILNAFRGGNLGASLGRFWFMPAFHLTGAFLGTLILIRAPSEPFILLLAVLLVLYLYRERLGKLDVPVVKAHWIVFGAAAGLAGGIFEATANVALAPLIIYFMILGVAPAANRASPVPLDRVMFGSHAPYFPVETAILKLVESPLDASQLHAIMQGNARKFLPVA